MFKKLRVEHIYYYNMITTGSLDVLDNKTDLIKYIELGIKLYNMWS
jgi:hypothetical protein